MSVKNINIPSSEEEMKSLAVGDEVSLSGTLITARDEALAYLSSEKNSGRNDHAYKSVSKILENGAIFNSGPVINYKENGESQIISIGPTTSFRMGRYIEAILSKISVRMIIGKGGFDKSILTSLKKYACVYIALTGGTAVYTAKYFTKVQNVFMRERFGDSEAMWVLSCENMQGVVAMDAHGNSLYKNVFDESSKIYSYIFK